MKFSIVTPAYNSEKFISETLESVISQAGNFSIEYFVMDGGSTDSTREIVQSYQNLLMNDAYPIQCDEVIIHWHSEKDGGMYDAINKGFKNASGDIFAWINSDDIYLPGAFNTIASVFAKFPEIEWLKGITSYVTANSTIYSAGQCNLYAQEWIAKGIYGKWLYFVQQDSVFWRRYLWEKAGVIDHTLKLAGDYSLWIAFSRFAPLVSVKAYVSCFRKVGAQLSSDINGYEKEMARISPSCKEFGKLIVRYSEHEKKLPAIMRPACHRLLFGKQTYRAVTIDSNDNASLHEGDYFTVMGKLI